MYIKTLMYLKSYVLFCFLCIKKLMYLNLMSFFVSYVLKNRL